MNSLYYSIRMHADRDARHLSGAERLVPVEAVETVSIELLQRAMRTSPGSVCLSVDEVQSEQLVFGTIPDVTLMPPVDYEQGREQAVAALIEAGVTDLAARTAMVTLAAGAATNGSAMRGAMLVDADSGQRLEGDYDRGVRATRLDLLPDTAQSLTALLQKNGLQHIRVREALVLAAKVLATPHVVAELCWSDAADYTAGYVASDKIGYRRFPHLKPSGDLRGGRAFFVQPGADLTDTIYFLEQTPFLANKHGGVLSRDGEQ